MKIASSILLCLVFLIFSCSDSPYYIKSHKFKDNTWRLKDKPSFTVDIKDTNQLYDFIFSIRTTTDYKYNNIWVYLYSTPPKGNNQRKHSKLKQPIQMAAGKELNLEPLSKTYLSSARENFLK